jgi:DNA replication protein DnaC
VYSAIRGGFAYVCGGVGAGKSWLGAVALRLAVWHGIKSEWISVPRLMLDLRTAIGASGKDGAMTEYDVIKKYSTVPFLVLDDFGVEKTSDYALQSLYLIANDRYNNCLGTLITSNMTLDELSAKLSDSRISSRLGCGVVFTSKRPDMRLQRDGV